MWCPRPAHSASSKRDPFNRARSIGRRRRLNHATFGRWRSCVDGLGTEHGRTRISARTHPVSTCISIADKVQLLPAVRTPPCDAAVVPQDRDLAGGTTGRFHALVSILPVKIPALRSARRCARSRRYLSRPPRHLADRSFPLSPSRWRSHDHRPASTRGGASCTEQLGGVSSRRGPRSSRRRAFPR